MERELLLTGIGGQGVQLAAQVLARGATLEGRHVMLFGVYGGAMRGMNTDATVVVGDGPLQSPPLISHTWSAIGMHDKFWEPMARKLATGALVLVNDADVRDARSTRAATGCFDVPGDRHRRRARQPAGGVDGDGRRVRRDHRARRARRAARGHARVDPAVPAAAHRGQRDRDPRRVRRVESWRPAWDTVPA